MYVPSHLVRVASVPSNPGEWRGPSCAVVCSGVFQATALLSKLFQRKVQVRKEVIAQGPPIIAGIIGG